MKKTKKPVSLSRRFIIFIVLCWAVPVLLFFTFTTVTYQESIIAKSEAVMEAQLSTVASFASVRIEEAVVLCRRPSTEGIWEAKWAAYQQGALTEKEYLVSIINYLRENFRQDSRFDLYAFYQKDSEKPDCYYSRAGFPQAKYNEDFNGVVQEFMEEGTDYTRIKVIDGRIFLMRNLYTTSKYQRYGTFVLELNKDWIFRDVEFKLKNKLTAWFNDTGSEVSFREHTESETEQQLKKELRDNYNPYRDGTMDKVKRGGYNGYFYQREFDHFHMGVMALVERRDIYSSLYTSYIIVLIMLLTFIPVMIYYISFMKRQIQEPIRRMTEASREIERGKIGYQMPGGQMPNVEFEYLKESFDHMSAQVKSLFESFYTEKLARKDAQLAALQAQINPHFLNNTLEMMNWQARMNGDIEVSKMIESLGTVLDYRMNRADVKEIPLREELRSIDAYFHIMSMRFGQRLLIEKEIDEELYEIMVPPLIIQPLVENAIVHGVETVKNGRIKVRVYHDDQKVYVEVQNTGKTLTAEDKKRIQAILNDGDILRGQGQHTSIGIRNVNRRVKLVYGEEYGLTIHQTESNLTVSTISLPYVGANMARINK